MSDSKRVCIIGPSTGTKYVGGVATHIKNLISLPCLRNAVILDPGSVNSNCRKSFFSIITSIFKMGIIFRRDNFDCVLINSSIYATSFLKLLLLLAVLPSGNNQMIHVFFHGGRFTFLNNYLVSLVKVFFGAALRKVYNFNFLSREQMSGFKKLFPFYPAKMYANYSTSDEILEKKFCNEHEPLHLLFVGRIVREKGVYELLSVVDILLANNVQIRLTIAGDGPDLPELIKQSDVFPPGIVRFLGFVTGQDLETAYRNADLLIFPTYHHEGFPYVVIESMRAGVPIISTSSGALNDLIVDGVTGFKVPVRDVEALVTTIKTLATNRPLINGMSQNCHEYFKNHLNKSAAERFYSNLLVSSV
jgi:glycosyltransferase involved in cell wall biosynthesis